MKTEKKLDKIPFRLCRKCKEKAYCVGYSVRFVRYGGADPFLLYVQDNLPVCGGECRRIARCLLVLVGIGGVSCQNLAVQLFHGHFP